LIRQDRFSSSWSGKWNGGEVQGGEAMVLFTSTPKNPIRATLPAGWAVPLTSPHAAAFAMML